LVWTTLDLIEVSTIEWDFIFSPEPTVTLIFRLVMSVLGSEFNRDPVVDEEAAFDIYPLSVIPA
jgi:hypothetical protein